MNGDQPAFPALYSGTTGMTYRQYVAAECLKGLLANPVCVFFSHETLAHDALIHADALIAAEKGEGK